MITPARRVYLNTWRAKNRLKLRKVSKNWYAQNKHRQDLKESKKEWWQSWYERNRSKKIEQDKIWRKNNIEKVRENKKRWRQNNPLKVAAQKRRYIKNNINARIALGLRARLRLAILAQSAQKKGTLTELIGLSMPELRKHLERQFKEDMSWDNYGKWHIDHIRPISSYNILLVKEQKLAFNYKNLQPLWAWENETKGSKFNAK